MALCAACSEDIVGSLSKRTPQALDAVSNVSAEQIERLELLKQSPTPLSPEERAELETALAAGRRGEFAGDAEVEAMYARHGQ
jgi:hypothetical protein